MERRRGGVPPTILAALLCIAILACGGRTVSTTLQTEGSAMPDSDGFRLTSADFEDGGAIPRKHTCDGADVSPTLSWEGAPEGTAALALIVDDPDARGFVHWVVVDMTGTATGGLPEAVSASPDAPQQGRNDFGRIGWGGPCPPSGTHRYVFGLYAMSEGLGLPGTPSADEVRRQMEGRVLAETRLTGTYTRER